MNSSLKRIGLILLMVILLPTLFYSVYEISSLSQNEEAIADIYERQLDAFLFSINQYSDDAISSWAGKMSAQFQQNGLSGKSLEGVMNENSAISHVFLADNHGNLIADFQQDSSLSDHSAEIFVKLLKQNREEKIDPLFKYIQAGYRKIETLVDESLGGRVLMIFVWTSGEDPPVICGFLIDPIKFINRSLSARMQTISDDNFLIAAIRKTGDSLIYATDTLSSQVFEKRAPLWLLPDYELGITSKGTTIEQLVRQRTYTNLGLILILDLVLLLGIWLVFRNIRKEIGLAQLKSDFVSNVSHEIRTPLSLISMFAETLHLDRVPSEEKRRQYYSILNQEALRLTGIVNKILNFSQIESGNRLYRKSPTDLNVVVENVLPSFEFHIQQQGFELEFFLEENLPIIQADTEAVSEALINLLDNAIKYSQSTKHIEVRTHQAGNYVCLSVADKGVGIESKKQEMIFDKFFRVSEGADIHNTKGAGLGLALVKHIIEYHEGKIELLSKLGKGSEFKLYFPLQSASI